MNVIYKSSRISFFKHDDISYEIVSISRYSPIVRMNKVYLQFLELKRLLFLWLG